MPYNPPRELVSKRIKSIVELPTVIPENGILVFVEDINTAYLYEETTDPLSGYELILSIKKGNHKWRAVYGRYAAGGGSAEEQFEEKIVGQVDFGHTFTNYPLSYTNFLKHCEKSIKSITKNFINLKDILWVRLSAKHRVTGVYRTQAEGQRYETLNDIVDAINAYTTDVGGVYPDDVIARFYLKQSVSQKHSLNRCSSYNMFFSQIRTRYSYKEATTPSTIENIRALSIYPWQENLVNLIYEKFLGMPGAVTVYGNNIYATVGTSTSLKTRLYSLFNYWNEKGKRVNVFPGVNATNKRTFDELSDNITLPVSIQMAMYIKDSAVFGRPILDPINGAIASLGNYPKAEDLYNNSCVRVYHLVDDVADPRYSYFMIKPIGEDTILTAFSMIGINDSSVGILVSDNKGIKVLNTLSSEHIFRINDNLGFRIVKNDYITHLKTNYLKNNPSKEVLRKAKFFHFDSSTGLISGFTPELKMFRNSAGSSVSLRMDRSI